MAKAAAAWRRFIQLWGGALWEAADKVFSIAIFLEQLAFVCCFFLFDYFNVLV